MYLLSKKSQPLLWVTWQCIISADTQFSHHEDRIHNVHLHITKLLGIEDTERRLQSWLLAQVMQCAASLIRLIWPLQIIYLHLLVGGPKKYHAYHPCSTPKQVSLSLPLLYINPCQTRGLAYGCRRLVGVCQSTTLSSHCTQSQWLLYWWICIISV